MDLALFKVHQFRMVNAASLVFGLAFFAVLLSNFIFLQTVWHYSVLIAALACLPNPVMTTITARPATRMVHKHGHQVVFLTGAVLFALAQGALALALSTHTHVVALWLPAMVVTGISLGINLPTLSVASTKPLPPAQFAVGSAINQSFRQLGAVLGVSLFAAILGTHTAGTALNAFHNAYWLFGALGLLSGLIICLPQLRRTTTPTQTA
ncbi:MFS transporter [Streptomyces chiangmaiensis]|uniref:MFS transporter n=1 Tax=Streptomyces chiangmaiensis TaxID=766497 RepID=A0ABU7FYJ6_9ACTN|nr:MFS transporter [Streptomyces chiangmaiensis]MED7828663.1 MFS transporter [Streptomyces chiangmaiensis]